MNYRPIMTLAVILSLSACGGSGDTDSSGPTGEPRTLTELIADGEASGELPTLDRTESVEGQDNDNDGVRDDVEQHIVQLAETPVQEKALMQAARSTQQSLVINHDDSNAVRIAANDIMRSISCMSSVYGSQDGRKMILRIESVTTNTPERLSAYSSFQKAASGGVFRLPSREGACNE